MGIDFTPIGMTAEEMLLLRASLRARTRAAECRGPFGWLLRLYWNWVADSRGDALRAHLMQRVYAEYKLWYRQHRKEN